MVQSLCGPKVSLFLYLHVQEEVSQGQKVTRCHQALSPCLRKINFPPLQPGSEQRASCFPQNKKEKKTKTKHCHAPSIPTGRAHAPLLGDRSRQSRQVKSPQCANVSMIPAQVARWHACGLCRSFHSWSHQGDSHSVFKEPGITLSNRMF